MEDRTEFICEHCNKKYSSYKSRWLHIKKYHYKTVIQNVTQSHTEYHPIVTQMDDGKDRYNCDFCQKSFKYIQGRWKHEKTCKETKNDTTDKIADLKKQNDSMKKELEELKNLIALNHVIFKNIKT